MVPSMTPIAVTIRGTTPLLCGRPSSDVEDPCGDPRTRAASRLYRGADGAPVVPALNCFRCLTNAAFIIDRSPAEVVHAIGIAERDVPIRALYPWSVDSRAVRRKETGAWTLCHRPRFEDWRLDFTLLIDRELLPMTAARELVAVAGQRIGIGDFRPERGGPFGRFLVESWSVTYLPSEATCHD
jgi:hypothetical protein